jgi:hypothetical protein
MQLNEGGAIAYAHLAHRGLAKLRCRTLGTPKLICAQLEGMIEHEHGYDLTFLPSGTSHDGSRNL